MGTMLYCVRPPSDGRELKIRAGAALGSIGNIDIWGLWRLWRLRRFWLLRLKLGFWVYGRSEALSFALTLCSEGALCSERFVEAGSLARPLRSEGFLNEVLVHFVGDGLQRVQLPTLSATG